MVTDRLGTRRLRAALLASTSLVLASLLLPAAPVQAQDATWVGSPADGNYSNGANWDTGTTPTGTASFGTSTTTNLSLSGTTGIGGWIFNAGASNYTFGNNGTLSFTGAGIVSNGGSAAITNYSNIYFWGNSTAGSASITNDNYFLGRQVFFNNTSTAGNATINNVEGNVLFNDASSAGSAAISNSVGQLGFLGSSTAGSAAVTNSGGSIVFAGTSTAGSATFTNSIAGRMTFTDYSTAGNATITAGAVSFLTFDGHSTAGNAQLITDSQGTFASVDFSLSTGPNGDHKLSAGSIAGDGTFYLGSNELTVGSNNLSTTVSGTIADTYNSVTGGSLVKTGTGTLTLSGANTYTGGTTINGGTLQLGNGTGVGSILGAVTVGSAGTFDIVNADTSGITTITNNGTTNFHNDTSAGSAAIANNNGGNLYFNDTSMAGSANITNSGNGNIEFHDSSTASTATITNNDTGWIYFRNSSTAGSATIINNYTLFFQNGSSAGSARITSNEYTEFMDNSTAGSAVITNNGWLYFSDESTGGNAKITNTDSIYFNQKANGGTAQFINNAAAAQVDFSGSVGSNNDNKLTAGSIAGNGTFYLGNKELTVGSNNLSTTVTGVIADGGIWGGTGASLVKTGTGTLTLSGVNTYTGGTTINAGTVAVTNNSSVGTGAVTLDGGVFQAGADGLAFANAFLLTATAGNTIDSNGNTLTLTGVIGDASGSPGVLTKAGIGTLILGGANTYTGGTTINGGTLQLAGAGTLGDISAATTVAGGTLDLGGTTQTRNGGVTLTGGSITNGTLASSGVFGVQAGSIDAGLAGSGALIKTGAGTLTLSGNNTYTGTTTVNAGTLAVNGSITASSGVTVNNGGTLGGTGQLPTAVINSGGTLAPGNSVGTITVNGNLAFSTGSFYKIEVSPTSADRTNVLGTATLTGATVQAVQLPGSFRAQTYTILNATGGFGGTQFAGLTGDTFAPGARNPHLNYDANNVFLVLDPGAIVLPQGASGNQSSIAGAINKAVESGFTPPAGFDALLNVSGAKLTNALNQVSGQPGATTTQGSFSAMQQFVTMINPFSGSAGSGQGGVMSFAGDALGYAAANSPDAKMRAAYAAVMPPAAPASLNERWGVWASGYGGSSTVTGNSASGASSTTSRIYGSVAGADYRVAPDTVVGFALGGAGFNFSVSDGLGSGRADLFQAGVYGRHAMGAAYISGTFAYGLQDVTTDRTVTVSGSDKLQANFKANTFTGRVESGYRFAPWPAFGATPYAAVQVSSFDLPGYRERAVSGSDQFALAYNAQTTTNVRTELGTRADKLFLMDNGLFTLSGRLAWAHDSNTDRPVTAAFQTLPGASFTVNGAKPAADSALVTAGAEMKWLNGFSLGGSFEGEFSSTTQTYAGKSTLRYAW